MFQFIGEIIVGGILKTLFGIEFKSDLGFIYAFLFIVAILSLLIFLSLD